METKISLTSDDFLCLVRGGILTIENFGNPINIILKDIGFFTMHELIELVENGSEKPHEGRTRK